jgi:predicted nucleic acid-binding protein
MKAADTTVLIDHARGDPALETYLDDHADETLVVPTIAFHELAVGEALTREESKEAVLANLGGFDVRPFTSDHAYESATIESDLRQRGAYDTSLSDDILIAGVARSLSVPVVTRNTDHFESFEGVTVESY